MLEVAVGVGMFTGIVMVLVAIILFARSWLVSVGEVNLVVNEEKTFSVPVGVKLHEALDRASLFISTACGGGGTCGQCRVKVLQGGGSVLPTEGAHISKREAAEGARLACQVTVLSGPARSSVCGAGSAGCVPTAM
jgi:Na+-transporting NADH:ubiquinone oxidoreductase subunit F